MPLTCIKAARTRCDSIRSMAEQRAAAAGRVQMQQGSDAMTTMLEAGAPHAAGEVALADKVAFLRRRESYPVPTAAVQAIETHMSWLFLTDRHAWKLKKPYRHAGIDYLTPAARRRSCAGELRLNRRLAPEVYLAVVPLTREADGRLALDGPGQRIDWLLKMQRLPGERSLEHRLLAGTVAPGDARRIVDALAPFFAQARHVAWTPAAYRRRLVATLHRVEDELLREEFALPAADVVAVAGGLHRFVATHERLFDARVVARRIVEGHGDLRPEHVYLTDPPTIIDCIEFDRRLRLRDPVDELAFLAMEAERLGAPAGFRDALFDAWADLAHDRPPPALVDYHQAHNAFIRAQIAVWHLDDPATGPRQPWVDRAMDYLHRAVRHLQAATAAEHGG